MLKQRVITAIILTAIFLGALFGLSAQYFPCFIGAVVLIGAWEWANLSSLGALWQRAAYALVIAGLVCLLACQIGLCGPEQTLNLGLIKSVLIVACGWWALALSLIHI